jgi:hypothetical protein
LPGSASIAGGQSNEIDPNSAVVPAREGTVLWFHAGALWTEQSLEPQSLAFVDALWAVFAPGWAYADSGIVGYAQIFARLNQQTARPVFRRAARREILRLLEMRAPGMGVGGFLSVDQAGRPCGADVSFLGGASGIGLVLLGASTGVDPLWDRFLLLSPLRLEPLS